MYSTKSIQVMEEDKFFSRLLSKESSTANPSLRVYHGGLSGAVPFMWESQPGTPKHASGESSLPPLTPPPSYYSKSTQKPTKNNSRSNLLQSLWFLRSSQRKSDMSTNSPSSISTSSSSSSCFNSRVDCEEEAAARSPTSVMCFGIGKVLRSQSQHQHCY